MSETGGQLNIAILPLMNEVGNYSLPRLQWPLEPLEPLKDTFEYVLSPHTIKFGAPQVTLTKYFRNFLCQF